MDHHVPFWWNVIPFEFLRLPNEVQLLIIDYAIPPRIFPATSPAFGPVNIHRDKDSEEYLRPLKLSCRQIYDLIKIARPVKAVSRHFLDIPPPQPTLRFRFNFKKDTLRVFDMALPEFRTANGQLALLPVERLVTVSNRMEDTLDDLKDEAWSGMQFGRKLDLGSLPQLKEFSFICQVAGREWKIESFEREGPQIEVRRDMLADKWGLVRAGYRPGAAKICSDSGLDRFAHTSIRWKLRADYYDPILFLGDLLYTSRQPHHGQCIHDICEPEDLARPDGIPWWMYESSYDADFIPYIGFYGYDRTQTSMGGNWAGFRYFEETGEV
ncbi:hypothetical protein ACHAPJ_009461 [Fusarium lateritium]